ncbi:hypothetical protein L6164_037102 [Bauhinia variegata]|uniref:Uncharacterized protein n=1 Tax=Bauhinia variegata TaxID=167791 RepID=A0ACB9KJU4_BAUVA|nr:hypothetical protein L6164_037102 [Bauhinia variegata]
MRPTLLPLLFLLTVSTITLLGEARPDPVFDTSGKKVRVGIEYYILPAFRGCGGGLTLASINANNPQFVVQKQHELLKGLPVTFARSDGKEIIRTSTDLNIQTSAQTTCVQSNVWRLKDLTGVWFVSANGVAGNQGDETIVNWFKIERADGFYNDYYISFCPTVSEAQTLCRQLGIYTDENGQRHLALSDDIPPFRVVFQRATDLSSSRCF